MRMPLRTTLGFLLVFLVALGGAEARAETNQEELVSKARLTSDG